MARSAKPLSASGSDSSLAHFTHWPRQRCTARHKGIWQGSKAGSSKVQDAMPIAQLRDCVDLWELEPQAWTLDKPQDAELSEHPTEAEACQTIKVADTEHIAQAVTQGFRVVNNHTEIARESHGNYTGLTRKSHGNHT